MVCFRNNHNKKEIVTEKRVKGKEETERGREKTKEESGSKMRLMGGGEKKGAKERGKVLERLGG